MKRVFICVSLLLAILTASAQETEARARFASVTSLNGQSLTAPQGVFPDADQIDMAFATMILEEYCKRFYATCFKDRLYIQNSIMVNSIGEDPKTGNVICFGTHSYYGKDIPIVGRKSHVNVAYGASIAIGLQGLSIAFSKWYEPDYKGGQGHWESCTNFMPY